jgi:hypothetical protein
MTHRCPGCRKVDVASHMFACRPCWYALPAEIRRKIWDTYRITAGSVAHRAAMNEAIHWYATRGTADGAS